MDSESQQHSVASASGIARRPGWPALLLGLIPFVALCFTVSLWDHIYPMVAGLPFNIFWIILWTLLTPLCMWGAYRCDRRKAAEKAPGLRTGNR